MKIGLVCPYNVTRGGGVFEIVNDMRAGLTARGHEVRILTPQPRNVGDFDTSDVIFLGAAADVKAMKTTPTFSASVDTDVIDHILEQEQFDVLHFHEPWVPVLSRQILSRSKAVNIGTFHAAIPETIMSRTIVKVVTPYTVPMLKYLHELTAVSDSAASYIRSLTDELVQIIPNGIDLARYTWQEHPARKDGTKTVLFVGRLEARKGVKWLLKAFKLLQMSDPAVRLVIAGQGPDREKLELLAEDLKLENVEFLGFVSDEKKMQLLAQADLFVSPALFGESFGVVLLEAMASGNMVVAGNNSGYEDVMAGIGQISIVNPRDDAEFARRMSLLLNEPKLQKVFRDWSKAYVKQFNYPHVIDMYEKLYKDALKKHGK
jgi:phosphatidyl-myo-inositol alpha-mannosyltransferase